MLPESIKTDPRKLIVLDWLANPKDKRLQKEIAAEVGVCYDTIRNWKNDPDMVEAVYAKSMQIVGQRLPEVLNAMVEKAIGGNVSAARLVLEQCGKGAKGNGARNDLTIVFEQDVPRPKGAINVESNDTISAN